MVVVRHSFEEVVELTSKGDSEITTETVELTDIEETIYSEMLMSIGDPSTEEIINAEKSVKGGSFSKE